MKVSDSTVSLSIQKSEFYSCRATGHEGGGIYTEGIGEVKVSHCLFYACTCASQYNYGGAGLEMWTIQNPPLVQDSSFVSCYSGNDAGGVGFYSCPNWQGTCVARCIFIDCKANKPNDADGGSIEIWYSDAVVMSSDSLFAKCYSAWRGGAVSYNITMHKSTDPLLSFCFFSDNTGNTGNDVYFEAWKPAEPFLHCFSTTPRSPRVVPSEHDADWLPQASINKTSILADEISLIGFVQFHNILKDE